MAYSMKRETLILVLIVLSVVGLLDSIYLASKVGTAGALFCDIGAGLDGCNEVAQSPYSRLLGVPLAYLGVLFYGLLLLASIVAHGKESLRVHQALLFIALIGALFSLAFLYVQLVLIQALCIYCIVSAGIAFLSLYAAYTIETRHRPNPPPVIE